jgi:hypothetical protein
MPFQSWTSNQLMSSTIQREDAIYAMKEEKRGKRISLGPSRGALPKYHLVYTLPIGQLRGPPL